MSISALGAGLSGMRSYQRALDVSANNIANTNTVNYAAQRVGFQQGASGGVEAVNLSAGNDAAAPDLASDIVDQLSFKNGYQLSAKIVQTADDMLGTLIDIRA